ncbi:unnamed protein product, partial [Polarella glacialis]
LESPALAEASIVVDNSTEPEEPDSIPLIPGETVSCVVSGTDDGLIDGMLCNGVRFVSKRRVREKTNWCGEAAQLPAFTAMWWKYLGLTCLCILSAATAAGLTLGLSSLEPWQMKVLRNIRPDEIDPYANSE